MAAAGGGPSGFRRGFAGLLAAILGAGGLVAVVYNNNHAEMERRVESLDQLQVGMTRLREAEVREHIANAETYNKRHAEDPYVMFRNGVDTRLRDERLSADLELQRAFNKAPNDGELRDCVKRFEQAVKGTVFATSIDVARQENSAVARYLDASGDRINELINMGWSEIRIDSFRKLLGVFREPRLEDQQPKLCRAFKGTTQ
jgi:hypothetical protein